MKKFLKIVWGIFAVIGILFVAGYIALRLTMGVFDISVNPNYEAQFDKYVNRLRKSGPFEKDTVPFEMTIVQDSVRTKEIRDYFQLDTLYAADADTWTKALSIGKFVASNVPHANQHIQPEHRNAIDLWEYTKNIEPAFNCRLHSILTFELMLAAGLDARYVTCLPKKDEGECHVMNEVWLPELNKWAMIDTDMDGNYVSDRDGTPLSLREIREHYISGEEMQYHPKFKYATSEVNEHYAYMAKNTYWFSCWERLSYYQEDSGGNKVRMAGRYINLVPSGFEGYGIDEGEIVTTNADAFWAAPTIR